MPLAQEAVASAVAYRASLPSIPDPRRFLSDWAILPMCLTTHGVILSKLGRSREAEASLGQAIDRLRELLKVYPDSNDLQFLLADALKEKGSAIEHVPARRRETLDAYDEAVKLLNLLVTRYPMVVHYAHYLAILRADRGAARLAVRELDLAAADLVHAENQLTDAPRLRRTRPSQSDSLAK